MTRNDLRELALLRLRDAEVLLANGRYEAAYYLCGYVVECALKACIARRTQRYDFPDRRTVIESYTHDAERLVKVAGLQTELDHEVNSDAILDQYWSLVQDWSEESRYARRSEQEARNLYKAIADRRHGVLRWLRRHW